MHRRKQLRRTGILCMHFVRNAAYFRAYNAAAPTRRRTQFWSTLNGNFIDICVLEWCKLFGDKKAQHFWEKSISEHKRFLEGLLKAVGMSDVGFEAYRLDVRTYRDKFVAHLDERNEMDIPRLEPALDSIYYLYHYLLENEDDCNAFNDAPRDAKARYHEHLEEGREAHAG